MSSVIRVSIGRPRLVIAVWLVLVAICGPLALQLSDALKAGGFENPRGEVIQGQQTLQRAFDEAPESLQVVLHDPAGDVTGAVDRAAGVARDFPNVASVADYRENAQWLSADRHTTFLQLGFQVDDTTIQNLITDLRGRLDAAVEDGVEVHVTGAQALDHDLSVQSEKDARTAEMIAFPLLFVVLLLVFRSVAAMLVSLVLAGVALVIAMAGGYLLTHVTDVSILFTNAVSIIGLAVAVDYSLFIIKRYRDELATGADYVPALRTAMRTAGHAVLFSGLAVVVALLALLIPRIMVFTSIALAGIVVTLIALAMAMTLVPAVLRLLGPRINWLSLRPRRTATSGTAAARFITRLHRRPVPLLLTLVALFGLLAWPTTDIRLQAPVASASILPDDADARQGIERLQAGLEARDLYPLQIVLTAPSNVDSTLLLDSVRSATQLAEAQPQSHSVRAVTNVGLPAEALAAVTSGRVDQLPPEAQAGVAQLWTEDGGRNVSRVIITPAEGPDSIATHDLVYALRDKLGGVVSAGVTAQVTGATAAGVDFDDVVVDSMLPILGAVALITFLLLLRAFRSWLLPLLALAVNVMVVSASLGLLTLISQEALGQPIASMTPALVFAVMFGLSMDYMVIMISRMREVYRAGGDHREAVAEGLRRTAGLVNGAALIMVAVFASFMSAQISLVQQLGIALAIAVILDAVVVRLLIMPAMLYLIGRRVWGRTPVPVHGPDQTKERAAV